MEYSSSASRRVAATSSTLAFMEICCPGKELQLSFAWGGSNPSGVSATCPRWWRGLGRLSIFCQTWPPSLYIRAETKRVCVSVFVRACAWVCVCERERERESERQKRSKFGFTLKMMTVEKICRDQPISFRTNSAKVNQLVFKPSSSRSAVVKCWTVSL